MTTVRTVSNNPASPFYNSSAPNLTGQVGSLTALLDAVLVTGFSGFTALGWTIGQTTTNKRSYIQGTGSVANRHLWVDDNAPTTAKEARVAGYATMSATTPTGTGQFPTNAQSSIGTGMVVIRKSATADATARYWTIVGNETVFYLFTETGDYTAPTAAFSFMFGDFVSYFASDTSNTAIIGRFFENSAAGHATNSITIYEGFPELNIPGTTGMSTVLAGHYMAANFSNVGGSLQFGKHSDQTKMGHNISFSGSFMGFLGGYVVNQGITTWPNQFVYPNPPDSGLYAERVSIHHGGMVHGYLKGLWCPLQHLPLNHNDTFNGSGSLSSSSFLAMAMVGITNLSTGVFGYGAQCFMETTNTW